MKHLIHKFWLWYEKHKTFNIGFAAILFSLQIVHLFWLTFDVVLFRATGQSFFHDAFHSAGLFKTLILIIDYTEIPALLSISLVYINELRKKVSFKPILYLVFLNSQWLHIFWITDEFVLDQLTGVANASVLPMWLAWVAIFIDYLELPVIYDTLKEFITLVKKGQTKEAFEVLKED